MTKQRMRHIQFKVTEEEWLGLRTFCLLNRISAQVALRALTMALGRLACQQAAAKSRSGSGGVEDPS